jgi:hypothetical protein
MKGGNGIISKYIKNQMKKKPKHFDLGTGNTQSDFNMIINNKFTYVPLHKADREKRIMQVCKLVR